MIGGERLGIVDASRLKQAAVYAGLRSRGVSAAVAGAKISGKWAAAFSTASPPAPLPKPVDPEASRKAKIARYVASHAAALPPVPVAAPAPLPKPAGPTIASIKMLVMCAAGVTEFEMASPSRARRITWPRQVAISLCRRWGPWSTAQMRGAFGNRDQSTIFHAIRETRRRLNLRDTATLALWTDVDAALRAAWPKIVPAATWWVGAPNAPPQRPLSMTQAAIKKRRARARKRAAAKA